VTASGQVIGPTFVLATIAERTGLRSILKSLFPESHEQLFTIACYLATEGAALSFCSFCPERNLPDLAPSLSSQRISELLASLTTDRKHTFFNWMKTRMEYDYLCYDITLISSYSGVNFKSCVSEESSN
jgi:hypothetical protein